jgi:hypothetical protein
MEKSILHWFWPCALGGYSFAFVAGLFLVVPRCNSGYLGHARPGYLLIPVGFVVALVTLTAIVFKGPKSQRSRVLIFAIVSMIVYGVVSLLLSIAGAHAMSACFPRFVTDYIGPEDWLPIWRLFFPFTLLFLQ